MAKHVPREVVGIRSGMIVLLTLRGYSDQDNRPGKILVKRSRATRRRQQIAEGKRF